MLTTRIDELFQLLYPKYISISRLKTINRIFETQITEDILHELEYYSCTRLVDKSQYYVRRK